MSLLMSLVFGILVAEISLISFISLPLPQGIQKRIVRLFYAVVISQQFRVGVSFVAMIISFIFLDSLKSSVVWESAGDPSNPHRTIWDIRVKKFYAQRNLYITGAILFLLGATYFNILLLESIVKNKERLIGLLEEVKTQQKEGVSSVEYQRLQEELKRKDLDAAVLRKQVESAHKAYQAAADEQAKAESVAATAEPVAVEAKKDI